MAARSGGEGGRDRSPTPTTAGPGSVGAAGAPATLRPVTFAPGVPTGPCMAAPLPVAEAQPAPGPSLVSVVPVKSAGVSATGGGAACGGGGVAGRGAFTRAGRATARRAFGAVGLVGSGGGGALGGATSISTTVG